MYIYIYTRNHVHLYITIIYFLNQLFYRNINSVNKINITTINQFHQL